MHIPPFDNKNKPIVDIEDSRVPLNYFNIVKLSKDQSFEYQTPGYETCIVPATGTINVEIEGIKVESLGTRTVDVWDGEPEGVYVPSNTKAQFTSLVDNSEIFIAGAQTTFVTTIAAAAEPISIDFSKSLAFKIDPINDPINASPAPVGFKGLTGNIPFLISLFIAKVIEPFSPFL